jgi:uncharacterized protein DUF4396
MTQAAESHHDAHGESLDRSAVRATAHCLTGCATGEVLGMVIATALVWRNTASIAMSVALAFVFGYAFTLGPILRAGVSFRPAAALTVAADTISIATKELADNAFLLVVPGAMAAGLSDGLFWWSLALSLTIAFVITVPVNKWLIARGTGHAVVHGLH